MPLYSCVGITGLIDAAAIALNPNSSSHGCLRILSPLPHEMDEDIGLGKISLGSASDTSPFPPIVL